MIMVQRKQRSESSESGISVGSHSPQNSTLIPEDGIGDLCPKEINTTLPTFHGRQEAARLRSAFRKVESSMCRHHGRERKFFCSTCKLKCCIDCAIKYHRSCDCHLTRKAVSRLCQTALKSDLNYFNRIQRELHNIQNDCHCKVKSLIRKIDDVSDGIIQKIEKQREELKNKLLYVEKERDTHWVYQRELCHKLSCKLNSQMPRVPDMQLRDINTLRKIIFAEHDLGLDFIDNGDIDVTFYKVPEIRLGKVITPVNPRSSYVVLPAVSTCFTYNTCTIVIRNILQEQTDGDYSITASLQDAHFKPVYLAIRNENPGTFKITYYPTEPGKYLLHVYLDRIPLGKSPYRVQVVHARTEQTARSCVIMGDKGEGKLRRPWGICSDHQGKLLVADRWNNCIMFFSEDGKFLKSVGKQGAGPGEFMKPTGIAVDHVLKRIVVCDKDNHRIQVLSMSGIYLLEFGSHGEGNGQFVYPWDVSVSEASLIAVSDSKNRRIQLFNQRGGFIRTFLFDVKEMPSINLPRGLAFRTDGSLLVTDFNKHRVLVLDDGFESIKAFGSEGTKVKQFFRPQSIDVDQTGKFAISDSRNHRIQVFQADGELFCAFGTQGSEAGQVDAPQGVCFLPNGRIAVVELNNNRVQVFEIPKGIENYRN